MTCAGPTSARSCDARGMAPIRHHQAVRAIIGEMRDRLAREGFRQHRERLDTLSARDVTDPAPVGSSLPVLRHVGDAVARSESTPDRDLVAAFAAVAGTASWTQTASYLTDPPSAGFLDQYAHATLLGHPDGAGSGPQANDVSLGLLLLGPDVLYPPHRHPADEVYLALTEAAWMHNDGSYRPQPVGALVHHESWQPHGMRTVGRPLLAIYLWTGDVTTPSEFC